MPMKKKSEAFARVFSKLRKLRRKYFPTVEESVQDLIILIKATAINSEDFKEEVNEYLKQFQG